MIFYINKSYATKKEFEYLIYLVSFQLY